MFRNPWYHGRLFSRTNLLLLIALCACEPKRLDSWPGRSRTPAPETEARVSSQRPATAWLEYPAIGQLALVDRAPVPTNNHNPFEWNMRVRITPAAMPLYVNWHVGGVMPVGTWIVAEHESRASGTRAPYYFANKTDAGWSFGAATGDGLLLPTDAACARCHADAPADFVFGPITPRSAVLQIEQRPDGG